MAKFLIAFVGQSAEYGTICGNETLVLDLNNGPLTAEDIEDLRECITYKKKLTSCAILNIMQLGGI